MSPGNAGLSAMRAQRWAPSPAPARQASWHESSVDTSAARSAHADVEVEVATSTNFAPRPVAAGGDRPGQSSLPSSDPTPTI